MDIAKTGYRNFGSFHTESVQTLITLPESNYLPPSVPVQVDNEIFSQLESLPLGKPCRDLFTIDFSNWTFINHGAFGGVCKPAQLEAEAWRRYCEQQPLTFIDRELFPQMVRVIRDMSRSLLCDPQDLVFVSNATTGLNAAIQSVSIGPTQVLYALDLGYGSVKKMAHAYHGSIGVVYGEVTLPITCEDEIVDLVRRTLPPNAGLAVFDAVTSNTAIRLPLRRLVQLCKERNVPVLIDAAHALGQLTMPDPSTSLPFSDASTSLIPDGALVAPTPTIGSPSSTPFEADPACVPALLDPDFWVANCHKWLAAPRGSALLWVRRDRQHAVRSPIISHGFGDGFASEFIWDGCRDYAPYLASSAAMRMWKALGPRRCVMYCRSLLADAVRLLVQRWWQACGLNEKELLSYMVAPLSMCGSMALVALPAVLQVAVLQDAVPQDVDAVHADDDEPSVRAQIESSGVWSKNVVRQSDDVTKVRKYVGTSTDAKYIQDLLHFKYGIECPTKTVSSRLFVRISCAIYNDLDDYVKLADAISQIADDTVQQPSMTNACEIKTSETETVQSCK